MKKSEVISYLAGNNTYRYYIDVTNRFKKDVVNASAQGLDLELLRNVVVILATEGKLPLEYKPHPLRNNLQGYMECHIQPDWLLLWKQEDDHLTLLLTNTGSHAYIFGM